LVIIAGGGPISAFRLAKRLKTGGTKEFRVECKADRRRDRQRPAAPPACPKKLLVKNRTHRPHGDARRTTKGGTGTELLSEEKHRPSTDVLRGADHQFPFFLKEAEKHFCPAMLAQAVSAA